MKVYNALLTSINVIIYWGKIVQRQPMVNGGLNVEIGNPSYNMYEVDHDNHSDAGNHLQPSFTLDPHKVWKCLLLYPLFSLSY